MYSIRNLLVQQPAKVKAAILAILVAAKTSGLIHLSGDEVAQWGLALEIVLGLLYVDTLTASTDALDQWQKALDEPKRPLRADGK